MHSHERLPAGLYLVATPIGNLGDITARAVDILQRCDVILCEDSRVTRHLTRHLGVDTPLKSFHDHNESAMIPEILNRIKDQAVALVSDAGTPLISDPGYKLVRAARVQGLRVTAAPGPSAAIMALSLSGLPSDRFLFAGFAPAKAGQRRTFYQELKAIPATLVIYETARRVAASLSDAAMVLGPREAAMCRELTKFYEAVITAPLDELAQRLTAQPVKGEIVLVIAPPGAEAAAPDDLDARIKAALGAHKLKDAAALVAGETGLSRKIVYARALVLRGQE